MSLTLEPIGIARTPFVELVHAPRQPAAARGVAGRIELQPGKGFEHALEGLEKWSHIWLVFWFHQAGATRKTKVSPPRSDAKRGVFATRSPHRPNSIGLSVVRLVRVEGLTVHVQDVDLMDGTPILDIKPYVPYTDSVGDASSGWLEAPPDPGPQWAVTFTTAAEDALQWLEARGEIELRGRLVTALGLGGAPHPYRRIRVLPDGVSVIAVKVWRARFRADAARGIVAVESIGSGYKAKVLAAGRASGDEAGGEVGDGLDLHRAFGAR